MKATRDTDTADSASGTGTLTVLAAAGNNQTITFAPLADKTVGDPPFTVSASASSGLPVSFAASGNCTVNVALVTLTGAGSCTITASRAAGGGFNAAPDVARTFSIHAADSGIDLYAVGGSTTIAGQTLDVWGYNSTNAPVTRPGGPDAGRRRGRAGVDQAPQPARREAPRSWCTGRAWFRTRPV